MATLSLKAELETWATALKAYDDQDFERALQLFSPIADSSKILTNIGLIHATIGEHETAVEHFVAATKLDPYLAIAHFQCGVSNFLLQRYHFALLNFEDAYLYLRGNEAINYDQIGLKFKLFSAEIMFNKALSQIHLGHAEQGMEDMQLASRLKVTEEHGVIDEAIRDRGVAYTVFSIPVGVLYRPSENKLKNSKSKDYLGKAKLVAASDSSDAFTEFTGVIKLLQTSGDSVDEKEGENKPDTKSSALNRSASVPALQPIATHTSVLERPKLTRGPEPGVRSNADTVLASRRSQSVSNPATTSPPDPPSNTSLYRSNSTHTRGNTIMPLRVKVSGTLPVAADGSRSGGETPTVQSLLRNQPNPRRPKVLPLAQPPAQRSFPQAPHSDQYTVAVQDATPLVLPAAPAPAQEGHLTQFYNTFMEAYMEDQALRVVIPRTPTGQVPLSASSSQKHSPASPSFHPPSQTHRQEQQQVLAWIQSASSPVTTSTHTSVSSGASSVPPRAANAALMTAGSNMPSRANVDPMVMTNQNTSKGGGGPFRRKLSRRQMTRRVTVYDDEEGDDGFVTGEYEEIEMANIRVKLHYQGDVRGMMIPPSTSFKEFVERVTNKFGTSLTGLSMKFTDEEGTKISLRDESDFELAIEIAREGGGSGRGRMEGKLEVWCVDV